MNLPTFLSWFSSNQKGLEDVISRNAELTAQIEKITVEDTAATKALEAEIAGLRTQVDAEKQFASVAIAEAKKLADQVADMSLKLADAEAKAAGAEAAAAIKVGTAIGATMGIPAALAPSVEATKDKPDFSSMRGLDKVVAIERWETAQRKNSPGKN